MERTYNNGIGITMLDPDNTTREDIKKLCDSFRIRNLTWKAFGTCLYFYKEAHDSDSEDSDDSDDSEDSEVSDPDNE
jgi:hypothetical protein